MVIDVLLVLFSIAGFWLGYTRGLIRTLFSVACYFIALILTLILSPYMMDLIIKVFKAGKVFALIFGTIFVMIVLIFLINWALKSVENYLKRTRIGAAGKMIGGILMMLLSMMVCAYFVYALVQLDWIGDKAKEKSHSYPVLEQVPVKTRVVISELKPFFRRYWELMENTIAEEKEK